MTDALMELSLVALTPADVVPAQAQLSDWCSAKMRELGQDYRDLHANLVIAKRNRWRTTALIPAVRKLKQRIQYYQKLRTAARAGYLIIPNLPIETIAVRVDRHAPRSEVGRYPTDVNEAKPELLPADTGRYVDEMLTTRTGTRPVFDEKGKIKQDSGGGVVTERWARSTGYDETIDFPIIAIKPLILEATERAMKQHIFDRIGIAFGEDVSTIRSARRRRSDPIVVGQVIDPRSTKYSKRVVSFFIAWWLDTRDL